MAWTISIFCIFMCAYFWRVNAVLREDNRNLRQQVYELWNLANHYRVQRDTHSIH